MNTPSDNTTTILPGSAAPPPARCVTAPRWKALPIAANTLFQCATAACASGTRASPAGPAMITDGTLVQAMPTPCERAAPDASRRSTVSAEDAFGPWSARKRLLRARPRLVLSGRRCRAAHAGPRVRLAFPIRNLAHSGPVSGFPLLLLLYFRIGLGVDASTPRQVGGELSVGRRHQRGDHERQNGVSQHRYPPVAFPPSLPSRACGGGQGGGAHELTQRRNNR